MKTLLVLLLLLVAAPRVVAATYHVDSAHGDDRREGTSPEAAWRTLERASQQRLAAGDRLLLRRGQTFRGALCVVATGTPEQPIRIAPYGTGANPRIDGAGHAAALALQGCSHVEVEDLVITADGQPQVDGSDPKRRAGVLLGARAGSPKLSGLTLRRLHIRDIFAAEQADSDGRNPTSNLGYGIRIALDSTTTLADVVIEGCRIERTGFIGIALHGGIVPDEPYPLSNVHVLDNHLHEIGGPGIQPSRIRDLVVRGNTVDGSGSSVDPRMHARGSGIWPVRSRDVLIERNTFQRARGKADSCGIHIDHDCINTVVQYNLSRDNEGGFVEILGNTENCAYRYNVSIDDGFRTRHENGALQDGKMLWFSSYTGRNQPRKGPRNVYVYNNTVYVREDILTRFSITRGTDGAVIANNIFYVLGRTGLAQDDQDNRTLDAAVQATNIHFHNNLYFRADTVPAGLSIHDKAPLIGDPHFARPGGESSADYLPKNREAIKDRGIPIERLPGDRVGVPYGFPVTHDFAGRPIVGAPDLGAFEFLD